MFRQSMFVILGLMAAVTLGCEKKQETPAVPSSSEVDQATEQAADAMDEMKEEAKDAADAAAEKANEAAEEVKDAVDSAAPPQ